MDKKQKEANHMNENKNACAPKTFTTIDGNILMAQEDEPLQFAVEKILPHGQCH